MSAFTKRIRGLEWSFPISGIQTHEPGELSEFVQLVHPALGPLQRIGASERQRRIVSGAAGVTNLNVVAAAPANAVRVVEYAWAMHDNAAAIHMQWAVNVLAAGLITIENTFFEGGGAAVPASTKWTLRRPVFLGPGESMNILAAVGAGNIIDAECVFIDYTAADLVVR